MGEFADAVRDRLRDALAERRLDLDWTTEHYVEGTPVGEAALAVDDLL